jgi:hypothetical protein
LDIVEGSTPSETEEDTTNSVRTREIGTVATLESVMQIDYIERKMEKWYTWKIWHFVSTSGLKEGSSGAMERNHWENQAVRKKGGYSQ